MEQDVRNLVQELEARWKSLTIANDFVFGKVMLDEDLCKDVLEAILATDIEKIEYVGRQDAIDVTEDGHGVRLDVYVRDDRGTVYSVEMQATNTHELPQRSRYYHAMLALSQIGKGAPYRSLRDSYVIFICGFDLFGQGRRVYSFQSRCEDDPDLCLNDGVHTIFLAATSPTEPQEGPRVNELLDYISSRKVTGELSSRLNEAVEHVLDNRKWRLEFMMQAIKDQLNVDKGRELGLEEGRRLGTRGTSSGSKKARPSARNALRSLLHDLTKTGGKMTSFAQLQTQHLGRTYSANTPSAWNNAERL